jgi:hypothetical protein
MCKHREKEGAYRAKPWRLSLSLVGGLVLLIGIALLAWSLLLRSPVRPSAPSVQYSPPQPPVTLSVAYEDAVKQSLAENCTWVCRNWRMRRKRTRMACLASRTRAAFPRINCIPYCSMLSSQPASRWKASATGHTSKLALRCSTGNRGSSRRWPGMSLAGW